MDGLHAPSSLNTSLGPAVLAPATKHFVNPVLPGADPYVVRHAGAYYLCLSQDHLAISIWRSDCLSSWTERQVVWEPPASGPCSAEVWAPELHRIGDRWYIYFAASDGKNKNHRMWVLESAGDDPLGPYTNRGTLYTGDCVARGTGNRWAIDGTVLRHHGQHYFLWSGWPAARDVQYLYIAEMSNPWTISSNRVQLCHNADYHWERVGESPRRRGLHEAPQILERNGRTFLIYSCSASWLPGYKLGMLHLRYGGDPMVADDWMKHPAPVFQSTADTVGVGHCSFTTSPDGREDWIVYHAKVDRQPGWNRAIHVQSFDWAADGTPRFGVPHPAGNALAVPSQLTPQTDAPRHVAA